MHDENAPMTLRHPKRRLLGGEKGQALVETAIMVSLLGMSWFLMYYACFLGNHAIRCAIGARHSAWTFGNGQTIESGGIASAVFWDNTNLVVMTQSTGNSSASGLLSSGGNAILGALMSIFPAIHTTDVRFGVDDPAAATQYPFYLMNTRFPFMRQNTTLPFGKVEAHCEWDSVDETWDSIGSILEGIIEGIAGEDIF